MRNVRVVSFVKKRDSTTEPAPLRLSRRSRCLVSCLVPLVSVPHCRWAMGQCRNGSDLGLRPLDVLPGLKSGDSRWRLTPLLGCFLLQHPLPQRVAVLHGLHSRLVSLPARQRE